MRDYASIAPQFWTGETGRELRRAGPEALAVALYLVTCPHANAFGLYYLPLSYLAHDTGLPLQGASKALQKCLEAGFCDYDEDSEVVWVYNMARFQIGGPLNLKDNLVKWVRKEWASLPKNKFLRAFWEKYGEAYHLSAPSPSEAPGKPLRSQEQDQDQEGDREQDQEDISAKPLAGSTPPEPSVALIPLVDKTEFPVSRAVVEEFKRAYPGVNVERELAKARAWCLSNPSRQKTQKGVMRFLNAWMEREQNKGGGQSGGGGQPWVSPAQRRQDANMQAARDFAGEG
ncbi:hypothetical protein [Desulfovibrio fairfieldensis]|uniref:Uncharacterized protein n=1 Tax=Desulfovibrio fairfieldensis TaxID=44742 RepID=A0A0X8JIP5_9BACT|nr:hypothetical protein [Desulfovibrio fairfieldensis]AMD89459.1 hypothetical protein AXF13_04660 [Desulfovibrio fairfieldensis]